MTAGDMTVGDMTQIRSGPFCEAFGAKQKAACSAKPSRRSREHLESCPNNARHPAINAELFPEFERHTRQFEKQWGFIAFCSSAEHNCRLNSSY